MCIFKKVTDDELTLTIKKKFAHICIIDFDCSIIKYFIKINNDLTFNTSFDHKLPAAKISNLTQIENLIEKLKLSDSIRFFKYQISNLLDKICKKNENLKDMICDQIQNLDISENLRRYSPFSHANIHGNFFIFSKNISIFMQKYSYNAYR